MPGDRRMWRLGLDCGRGLFGRRVDGRRSGGSLVLREVSSGDWT